MNLFRHKFEWLVIEVNCKEKINSMNCTLKSNYSTKYDLSYAGV